jgi:hypothetical protein
MKRIGVTVLTLLTVVLTACGGGSSTPAPKSINGFWTAGLQNPDGSYAMVFNAVLAPGSGSALNISNFLIMSPSSCFTSTTSQSGTFTVTGSSGGYQTGPFTMTVSTIFGTAVENVATLTGTRDSNGRISGNWTLTGFAGCNSSGTFLMTPPE